MSILELLFFTATGVSVIITALVCIVVLTVLFYNHWRG